MTNAELNDLIDSGRNIKVHLSKESFSLIVDGAHHIITEEQCGILWDALPILAQRSGSHGQSEDRK